MKKLLLLLLLSSPAFAQLAVPVTNAGTTGTTLNATAIVNSSDNAVIATTSSTTVPTYIVVGGAGTTGQAQLALYGQASCLMDSTIASAAGWYYVVNSTTVAGDCHAQSAAPSAGVWVIGYLAASATTSGSAALVNLNSYVYGGAAGGTVGSVANSDGTLTISPTTGAVIASLALGHANTWTATQTFSNITDSGLTTGYFPLAGNPMANSHCDDGQSTAGTVTCTEPVAAPSYSTTGSQPGSASYSYVAGTIPALPANSAGWVAPPSGGTSYLGQLPATMTAGFARFSTPATLYGVNVSQLTSALINVNDLTGIYIAGGGTAQAQTATLSPAATALVAGVHVYWKPTAANTAAAPTLAVNGLTATAITKCGTAPLIAGDLSTTSIADAFYDGTQFELLNPQAAGCGAGGSTANNSPWLIADGAGNQGNHALSTANTIYFYMVPNGPTPGQTLSYLMFNVGVADATGTDYYDIGIYGPCAFGAASCPLVADVGSGTQGITLTSTGVKNLAIHQSAPVSLTAPTAGQFYFYGVTGNATTVQFQQLWQGLSGAANSTSSTTSTNGQLPSTAAIPAASWGDANQIGLDAHN